MHAVLHRTPQPCDELVRSEPNLLEKHRHVRGCRGSALKGDAFKSSSACTPYAKRLQSPGWAKRRGIFREKRGLIGPNSFRGFSSCRFNDGGQYLFGIDKGQVESSHTMGIRLASNKLTSEACQRPILRAKFLRRRTAVNTETSLSTSKHKHFDEESVVVPHRYPPPENLQSFDS
jgi:hypothetical protein